MSTGFSAGPQALGYLYQARYALLLVIKSRAESEIRIEGLDDIEFQKNGTPSELLQLKHHTNRQASLSDSSTDLWKTIRVWSTLIIDKTIDLAETSFSIITTATAAQDTAAFFLKPGEERDPTRAIEKLRKVAQTSSNKGLAASFRAFQSLQPLEQVALVNSIQVLDCSAHIVETASKIKKELEIAVRPQYLESLYERLEGWWLAKVISHLDKKSSEGLLRFEVFAKIHDISDQFHPDALPIDFFDAVPENLPDAEVDTRRFVAQLKEVAVNNQRIEKAILDYYRAFEQRSRWAREDLLISDEIEKYEKKLIDEWERYRLLLLDDFEDSDEVQCKKFGRKLYNWMDQTANIRIRSQVSEEYVMRGSYHMLADRNPPNVFWHPKFLERLEQLLVGASK